MLAFIIRRIAQSLFVMAAVALIAFLMFRFVGDPVNQMVGIDTPQEEVARLRESLGLNDPAIVQFGRFVWNIVHFDFGISYQFRLPVTQLLAERAPATLELAVTAAIFALIAWSVIESASLSVMLNLKTNLLGLPKAWFQWALAAFSALTAIGMALRAAELALHRHDIRPHQEGL